MPSLEGISLYALEKLMRFCSPRVLYQLAFLVHLRSSVLVKTFTPTSSTIKWDDCVKSNIKSISVHRRDSREIIFQLGWSFILIVSVSSHVRSLFGIEFIVLILIFHNGFFKLVINDLQNTLWIFSQGFFYSDHIAYVRI